MTRSKSPAQYFSYWAGLFLFVVALIVPSQISAADRGIKIGVIMPLTGDFGFFGEQARQGMTVALNEIAERGGRKVEVIYEDDRCLPRQANIAFNKLTQIDQVDLILGPACSGSILSIAPLVKKANIRTLAILDAGEEVRKVGAPLYAFGFNSEESGRIMAERMWKLGHKKVGILIETDEWSLLVKNAFVKKFRELGGEITTEVVENPGGSNFRPGILRLIQSGPDALYVVPTFNGGLILKQLRDGPGKSVPVFGPDTLAVKEVIDIAGPAAEGVMSTNAFVDEKAPMAVKLRTAIEARSGATLSSLRYSAMGYDGIWIAYKALTSDRPFAEAMQNMHHMDGVIPVKGFDRDGVATIEIAVYQIKNQDFVRVDE